MVFIINKKSLVGQIISLIDKVLQWIYYTIRRNNFFAFIRNELILVF